MEQEKQPHNQNQTHMDNQNVGYNNIPRNNSFVIQEEAASSSSLENRDETASDDNGGTWRDVLTPPTTRPGSRLNTSSPLYEEAKNHFVNIKAVSHQSVEAWGKSITITESQIDQQPSSVSREEADFSTWLNQTASDAIKEIQNHDPQQVNFKAIANAYSGVSERQRDQIKQALKLEAMSSGIAQHLEGLAREETISHFFINTLANREFSNENRALLFPPAQPSLSAHQEAPPIATLSQLAKKTPAEMENEINTFYKNQEKNSDLYKRILEPFSKLRTGIQKDEAETNDPTSKEIYNEIKNSLNIIILYSLHKKESTPFPELFKEVSILKNKTYDEGQFAIIHYENFKKLEPNSVQASLSMRSSLACRTKMKAAFQEDETERNRMKKLTDLYNQINHNRKLSAKNDCTPGNKKLYEEAIRLLNIAVINLEDDPNGALTQVIDDLINRANNLLSQVVIPTYNWQDHNH
jgi:hypothetical protein